MKNNRLVIALIAGITFAHMGCHPVRPPREDPRQEPSARYGPDIAIEVYESDSLPLVPIDGATVSAVLGNGEIVELGQTVKGTITLGKGSLKSLNVRVLLFTHPRFFSGAIRVDDPQDNFYGYDERFINLARLVLY